MSQKPRVERAFAIAGLVAVIALIGAVAQNAKLKTAIGVDMVLTGTLIKQLDQAGSNGTKVAAVILTVQWRALGQDVIIACSDID